MKSILFPVLLIVLTSACIQQSETVACPEDAKLCPDGSAVGRVSPTCEFAPCPVIEVNETPTSPQTVYYTIEADDNGFYMSGNKISSIDANRTNTLVITFQVRNTNVYYGGLDFRSVKFDTPDVLPGGQTEVSFVADNSFTITSYWPASNVRKADLQVLVT